MTRVQNPLLLAALSLVLAGAALVLSAGRADGQTNQPPIIAAPATIELEQGAVIIMIFPAHDPEGTAITYSHTGAIPGLTSSQDSDGVRFQGNVTSSPGEVHSISITATDQDGQRTTSTVEARIITGERVPVIFNPVRLYATPGEDFVYRMRGVDANGEGLRWESSDMPPGISVSSTGFIVGEFPSDQTSWISTVAARDSNGISSPVTIEWLTDPSAGGSTTTTTTTSTTTTTTTTTAAPSTTTTTAPTTTTEPTAGSTTSTSTITSPTNNRPTVAPTTTVSDTSTVPSPAVDQDVNSPATSEVSSASNPASASSSIPGATETTTTMPETGASDQTIIAVPPSTTAPPPPIGSALEAADDAFVVPVGTHTLSVAQNDQRLAADDRLWISSIGEPSSGAVHVEGDQLVVSTGDFAGPITLSYTITDGITSDQATVTVTVVVAGLATTDNDIALDFVGADTANVDSGVLPTLDLPAVLLAFLSLELGLLSLPWAIAALVIPVIVVLRMRSAAGWANVVGVPNDKTAPVHQKSGELRLRHDARDVWLTGRKRRGLVQVETFGGTGWMDPDHLRFER